ncbi:DUF302 domain-containing protein [Rubrimonas cliftonensis]|uniref:Uncharacterized conserved protein, DUF302 family n=1 Tax=Rubrimonas cliftonensis TaxID=89524 RepID=A0A1H3XKT9_9RHOB|nr:DUF302 domain-containing protein [Rubrimonas cliftonensis]SDZ99943.1 Uncharacterized conserved protein, DUF302 family [Rubrimonas cliftonensis]
MRIIASAALILAATAATALDPREGWAVADSAKSYAALLADLKDAVKAEKMGLVTEAGPTEAAAARGETIPGNRVVGVFRPDFAVRAVRASEAAMIEAPIRFYVTENADGTATLSYKTPSFVFAPYVDEGGAALASVGDELDAVFAAIAARALAAD